MRSIAACSWSSRARMGCSMSLMGLTPHACFRLGFLSGRAPHGCNDVSITATATHVAVHVANDFLFARGGIRLQKACGRHDHSRSAVGALERFVLQESLLHGMKLAVLLQTFNRGDLLAHRGGDVRAA